MAPQHEDASANLALLEQLLRQQQQGADSQGQPTDEAQDAGEGQGGASDAPQDNEGTRTDQGAKRQTPPEAAEPDAGPEDRQAGSEAQGAEQQAAEQQAEAMAGEEAPGTREQGTDEDSAEAARQDVASQVAEAKAGDPTDDAQEHGTAESPRDRRPAARPSEQLEEPPSEADLALEQWLGQIPEDPAGLLRRKFMLEHLRRQREGGQ